MCFVITAKNELNYLFISPRDFLWLLLIIWDFSISYLDNHVFCKETFSSFLIHVLFVSFSLIMPARTSSMILNWNGGSKHHCLVLDLSRDAFRFPTTNYHHRCRIFKVLYQPEKLTPISSLLRVLVNECSILPNAFLYRVIWSNIFISLHPSAAAHSILLNLIEHFSQDWHLPGCHGQNLPFLAVWHPVCHAVLKWKWMQLSMSYQIWSKE